MVHSAATLALRLGPSRSAAAAFVAGFALTSAVGLVLGLGARAVQGTLDASMYEWFEVNFQTESWAALNATFTQLGDVAPMVFETAAFTVLLALLYWRQWWIPALALPLGLASQWVLQRGLEHVVARGHPLAGAGTFPSGGSARFIVIYGLVVFLLLLRAPRLPRYAPLAGAALVTLLAVAEGYSRLYLLMHWPTDILGGWVIGVLLLATIVTSLMLLLGRWPQADAGARAAGADRGALPR